MMTTSPPSLPSKNGQGRNIPGWFRSISLYRIGIMVLILTLLFTISSYTLQAMLNYPAILIDKAPIAISLVAQGAIVPLLGFIVLLLCGVLLIVISLGLVPYLEEKRGRRVLIAGCAAGTFWAIGALLGLALVPLWGSARTNEVQVFAAIILVFVEIFAPLLLVFWTVSLARQFPAHKVLGWLGAIGLLLVFLRSLIWALNEILPIEAGLYGTAGLLTVLAVIAESFWLVWLFLFSFDLMHMSGNAMETTSSQWTQRTEEGTTHL